MRNLIFGIMLGVVAAAGLYTAISASVAAAGIQACNIC